MDRDVHLGAAAITLFVIAFAILDRREVQTIRRFERENPFTTLARKLNTLPNREWCDDNQARNRLYASEIVDRFGDEIRALWKDRGTGGEPKFALLDLGVIKLRINPKAPPGEGFDSSAWSWDEAAGLISRARADPNAKDNVEHWRDLDSMVRFLVEKDYGRLVYGKKFLAPDVTEHQFRPDPSVTRTGEHVFTVKLNPGDFRSREAALEKILESEWQGGAYRVRIQWVDSDAYRLTYHSDTNRSFVNHRLKTMDIANLAWTKTVAHELGHVLGFDDHYYNVWNGRNCYYSQESRMGDLMSNSEHGVVTARHWAILDHAYPWNGAALTQPFNYAYGK
ncbi:MAG: hypothetical protein ACXWR1_00040 [Bdellovibrionota bacterium]